MKLLKNKNFQIILLLLMFLLFLRIDFRFDTTVKCCSDEYDYFTHAVTIVEDFDLDYSNQNIRDFSYYGNGKNTPLGFIGTGLLASPFLFIGSLVSSLFDENLIQEILNFKFLLYSLSSVTYFFLSYFLINNTLTNLNIKFNNYFLILVFSGSGITYYAFERFGMTHVFEVFGLSLLINISIKYYKNKNSRIYAFLVPFVVFICFVTRMSNVYVFIIPLIAKLVLKDKKLLINNWLITSKEFIIATALSSFIYYKLSYELYGMLVFNAQKIYGTNISIANVYESQNNLLDLFISLINTLFITLFSNEFGIFWISPILFLGLFTIFYDIKKIFSPLKLLLLFCFAQNLFIVHIWQALGSSYGFRYLFSLTPLSIIIYFCYLDKKLLFKIYIFVFSVFSNLAILFFETTEQTQLSTTDGTNSFGKIIRYIEPEYVTGVVLSLFEFQSYLIIFTTSFLGVFVFKTLFLIIDQNNLINFLERIGLPVQNQDFSDYIDELNFIGYDKILFIVLFLSYFSYLFVRNKKGVD